MNSILWNSDIKICFEFFDKNKLLLYWNFMRIRLKKKTADNLSKMVKYYNVNGMYYTRVLLGIIFLKKRFITSLKYNSPTTNILSEEQWIQARSMSSLFCINYLFLCYILRLYINENTIICINFQFVSMVLSRTTLCENVYLF